MAKILLVDDDATLLLAMTLCLRGAGHEVVTAANGNEALVRVAQGKFDLIVTDLLMPEREGLETIVAVREQNPQQRVMAISGGLRSGPLNFLKVAQKLGASVALEKPFGTEVFLAGVEKALRVGGDRPIVAS